MDGLNMILKAMQQPANVNKYFRMVLNFKKPLDRSRGSGVLLAPKRRFGTLEDTA